MITTEFVACKYRANAGNSMNREQGAGSGKREENSSLIPATPIDP
jgi:hypothetical protein